MSVTHARQLGDALRWALESTSDPAAAAVDWIARDIDPSQHSAISLITNPDVPLEHLRQAKDVFKTMRVIGETKADRRAGARFYLATIAAAMATHGRRISRQSDRALKRALKTMLTDREAPAAFRALASNALNRMYAEASNRRRPHDVDPSPNGSPD